MRKALRLNMALRGPVLLLLLGAIAVLVAACGSDPTATPRPTNTPLPTAVPVDTGAIVQQAVQEALSKAEKQLEEATAAAAKAREAALAAASAAASTAQKAAVAEVLAAAEKQLEEATTAAAKARDAAAAAAAATAAAAAAAAAAIAIPEWQLKYDAVLKAALAEGEVVIAMGGSASRNYGPRFDAFENETGIKVIAATGRGSQQVEKIRSEREAKLFTTDLWMTGVTSTKGANNIGALQDNFLEHFIRPDILDSNNWMDGKHWFPIGLENTTMAFCASPNVQFSYNTDLVDPSTLKSFNDLVDGRFKGMIVGILPWEPGQTNGEFWINTPALGTAFIDKLILESDAEWVVDGQQGVDLLANGVKAIFMPTGNASDDIDDLREQGLPVANHLGDGLAEGSVLGIGGTCSVSILKDAPNPNAQTIFLNWWYSADNLHAVQGITNDQSLRNDVSSNNLDPQYIRNPDIKYFFPEADPDVDPNNPGLAYARKVAEENGLR